MTRVIRPTPLSALARHTCAARLGVALASIGCLAAPLALAAPATAAPASTAPTRAQAGAAHATGTQGTETDRATTDRNTTDDFAVGDAAYVDVAREKGTGAANRLGLVIIGRCMDNQREAVCIQRWRQLEQARIGLIVR